MTKTPITKRPLKNVGENIWRAIEVMEKEFAGQLTHDSGHGKHSNDDATTWILTFPRYGDAQIAVPMNKEKLSLLMRGKAVDGRLLESLVNDIAEVEKRYTNQEKGVASSVLGPHAPFLNPSPANPLVRVKPSLGEIHTLLERYLGTPLAKATPPSEKLPASPERTSGSKTAPPLSEDDLRKQLERQSETGRAGEFLVVEDELERLRQRGCPNPEKYVRRIAENDVGRGYDVESTWPDEERCIEVKTTTRAGSDFFLTANERSVLTSLGPRAWLYRVVIDSSGQSRIETRLNNPMNAITEAHMTPVVWRVAAAVLEARK